MRLPKKKKIFVMPGRARESGRASSLLRYSQISWNSRTSRRLWAPSSPAFHMPVGELPRRSSRQHLPSAKSMDFSSPRHAAYMWSTQAPERAVTFAQSLASAEQLVKQPAHPPPPLQALARPSHEILPSQYLVVEASVQTNFGDTAVLVGSTPQLGGWEPTQGWRLSTDAGSYPVWKGEVPNLDCSRGEIEYKLVILRAGGLASVEWEPLAHNRRMLPGAPRRISLEWGVETCTSVVLDVPPTPSTTSAMKSVSAANHTKPTPVKRAALIDPPAPTGPPSSPGQTGRGPNWEVHSSLMPALAGAPASQESQPATPSAFAMAQAPRPNASFSVITAHPPAAIPTNGQGPAFDPHRAMGLFARPPAPAPPPPPPPPPVPPVAAPATPPMAVPLRASHLNQLPMGSGRLDTIMSQDLSWPPSLGAMSYESLRSSNSNISDGQGWDR